MAKREWRKPTEADRQRKCRARSPYEKQPFYVVWNDEYKTWALADRPHILVAVREILAPAEQADAAMGERNMQGGA